MDTSRSNTPSSKSNTPSLSGRFVKSTSAKSKLLHDLEERSKERMEMYSKLVDNQNEDEVDLFMRSMALMLKKLPPNLINQAKLKILTLITNLQASMTNPEQPQNPSSPVQMTSSPQQLVYLQIPGELEDIPNESVNAPQPSTSSVNPQYNYTTKNKYFQL